MTYEYDPDLPYVVEVEVTATYTEYVARFARKEHAQTFLGALAYPTFYRVIDTTPAPRVPEDAKFITWRDQGNDRWYAEREGDTWCTDDGELFGNLADLPDVTPDTVFTVLEERK